MLTPITMTVDGANMMCKSGTGVALKSKIKRGDYLELCKDMCKIEPDCRQVSYKMTNTSSEFKCTLYRIPCTPVLTKQGHYIITKEGGPTQDEQAITNEKDIALLKQQHQIEALQK